MGLHNTLEGSYSAHRQQNVSKTSAQLYPLLLPVLDKVGLNQERQNHPDYQDKDGYLSTVWRRA
jgi:hypothetical protein